MKTTRLLAPVMLSMALAACGGGGDDDGGGTPSSTSMLVTAAAGGEVTLEDGAGVNIPAGALAADTTITIESSAPSGLPEASTLKGLVYDFGPDGTTFTAPVTLTLPVSGTPADGETAVVSWLDESNNTWQDLTTTMSGGMASADTTHFTRFMVRFKAGAVVECSIDLACSGGDPVGTWTLVSACLDSGTDTPFPDCPSATIDADFTGATGTLAINGDNTYSADFAFTGTLSYTLPAACLGGQPPDCAALSDDPATTCATASDGDGCTCTATITDDDPTADTGTYVISGNQWTSTPADGSTGDTVTFCVNGDTMTVGFNNGDTGALQIITLER